MNPTHSTFEWKTRLLAYFNILFHGFPFFLQIFTRKIMLLQGNFQQKVRPKGSLGKSLSPTPYLAPSFHTGRNPAITSRYGKYMVHIPLRIQGFKNIPGGCLGFLPSTTYHNASTWKTLGNIVDPNIAPRFPLASLRSSSMLPKNINRMLTPGRSRRKCLNISLTLAELQKKDECQQKMKPVYTYLLISSLLAVTYKILQPHVGHVYAFYHNHGSEK